MNGHGPMVAFDVSVNEKVIVFLSFPLSLELHNETRDRRLFNSGF